jgi:integrase
MICSVFRPSRVKNGKGVKRRLYWGQYRLDGDREITRVPLSTPDKQVARERLDKLVRTIQKEREGMIAPSAMRAATSRSVIELGDRYAASLDELGRDDHYVKISGDRITRLSKECGWNSLRDVTAASFQQWRARQKTSPKTVNDYLATVRSFFRWMMRNDMATFDPFVHVERVEERGRHVRQRRAFTVDEVTRLLQVAPIERQRFYIAAYYTGLRRSELESLQWGDVRMDDEKPYIFARAATTKNKQDTRLWIRPELLEILRALRPEGVPGNEPVFGAVLDVPGGHKLRRFQRDLQAAGIPYKDAQGRIADFHALSRVTPNTHMGQRGVGERVRQEFMRHSDLRLTSAVYTDAEQLPTRDAIMALPTFAADGAAHKCAQRGAQSSGSCGLGESQPVTEDWTI